MILLSSLSYGIMWGVPIQTNLQLWKVCHIEMGHNDTVCKDMNTYPYETVKNEVQIFSNDFSITDKWVSTVPAFIYVIFAGALSDRYGRRPLLLLPLFGNVLSGVFSVINFAFIR
jgi:hypothetical protein